MDDFQLKTLRKNLRMTIPEISTLKLHILDNPQTTKFFDILIKVDILDNTLYYRQSFHNNTIPLDNISFDITTLINDFKSMIKTNNICEHFFDKQFENKFFYENRIFFKWSD